MILNLGLDIGSTTVKIVGLDENDEIIFKDYTRHKSDVIQTCKDVLNKFYNIYPDIDIRIMVTGSGAMVLSKTFSVEFVQEVVAQSYAIKRYLKDTDVSIELGGEDSKITYLSGQVEQRMNSICAGGTGSFIDQMASLMDTDALGLNELAKDHTKIFPIASRCGVFAKTDVQALLNDGASKSDIAASVFQSVVNQTISNLACGRPIKGNIALIGGPLHFLSELRERFKETLNGDAKDFFVPEDGQIFVCKGAALASKETKPISFKSLVQKFNSDIDIKYEESNTLEPLFKDEDERKDFYDFHNKRGVLYADLDSYEGNAYLGIDAGSTTSKIVLLSENEEILYTHYANNQGKPLELLISVLLDLYEKVDGRVKIKSSGITGYGEDFIRAAIGVDYGEVETIAHYRASKKFIDDVSFIIDIGGQDMKAMHISDGVIDSIQLNEACSSGCGSFIETFAKSLGMDAETFQKKALESKNPVDLGSRCTVFMNSKVKEAQKEGHSVEDIAAGLCYSVIKNALQKVIKLKDPKKLGDKVICQGGTFYGDGVLRAFEKVSGVRPIRPSIAGLMGAYGMALIAKEKSPSKSTLFNKEELEKFTYTQKSGRCGLCENNCKLNINIFSNGKRYISGNRCERGAGLRTENSKLPNLFEYKYDRLFSYESLEKSKAFRGEVGIPRALNIYENYPLWHGFFTELGFRVVLSDPSSREIYEKGISSIISETACYPAKISHGHIENLVEKGVKFIFYPSIFYEEKEYSSSQNNLNCPVVAGYPEVIRNNVDSIEENDVKFLNPFISLNNQKALVKRLYEELKDFNIPKKKLRQVLERALKS